MRERLLRLKPPARLYAGEKGPSSLASVESTARDGEAPGAQRFEAATGAAHAEDGKLARVELVGLLDERHVCAGLQPLRRPDVARLYRRGRERRPERSRERPPGRRVDG